MMHVVAAYDVRDDKTRERLRRLLWRYGLSPISKSVYAGRLNWDKARRIASIAAEILGPHDTLVIVPLQDNEFKRAIIATSHFVSKRMPDDIIVIDGGLQAGAGENPGRGRGVQDTRLPNGGED